MADVRRDAESAGTLRRAKEGDLAAFEQLVREHETPVFSTALRFLGNSHDAEDAAQEVFLKLFRNLKTFGDAVQIRPWLYRVTVNACHDLHRQRQRLPTAELTGAEIDLHAGPEALSSMEQRQQILGQALEKLAPKERAAVVLRDVQGLSTREVAQILQCTETTVRSQISTARTKLKKFTDKHLRKRI